MKARLMIDGILRNVEIDENGGITTLNPVEEKKPTGWERAENDDDFRYIDATGLIVKMIEDGSHLSNTCYNAANHFSDNTLAENISLAQTIWRKLLRWQAENDDIADLNNLSVKWHIYYHYSEDRFLLNSLNVCQPCFSISFSSKEKAQECIDIFHDELVWLFTEFKSRMDGEPN